MKGTVSKALCLYGDIVFKMGAGDETLKKIWNVFYFYFKNRAAVTLCMFLFKTRLVGSITLNRQSVWFSKKSGLA